LFKTFFSRLLYLLTAIFAAVCTNKVAKLKAQVSLPSDALAAVIVMDNRPTPYSAWILEGMQRTTSLNSLIFLFLCNIRFAFTIM